jgi:hypothetical protein
MGWDEFQPSTVLHHLVAGPGLPELAISALRARGGLRLDRAINRKDSEKLPSVVLVTMAVTVS